MGIFDFDPEPAGPFHDTSVLHRLIVHDDPEDGFDIEHPPGCVAETGEWDNGLAYVSYDCDVAWHIDGVGIDYTYRHAFDDPDLPHWSREPLLPGVYTCWVETVNYQCWDCLGGYEYDSTLWVEPQKALTVGPDIVEAIGRYIDEMRTRYRLSGTTHWYLALCLDCGPPFLPQPFRDETEREIWTAAHASTGHRVELSEEWR